MVDESVIREAARRLADAAPSARVILFGSYARGDAASTSDVDFLVVEPSVDNEAEESVRLMRVLRELRVPAEVIVVDQRYLEKWRHVRGSLVYAAVSEGTELFANGRPA